MAVICESAKQALSGLLFNAMTICAGGFGLCGAPERLIDAVQASAVRELTCISNNAGIDGEGFGKVCTGQVKKMIASYVRENKQFDTSISRGNWR